jgi:hypothetical protein
MQERAPSEGANWKFFVRKSRGIANVYRAKANSGNSYPDQCARSDTDLDECYADLLLKPVRSSHQRQGALLQLVNIQIDPGQYVGYYRGGDAPGDSFDYIPPRNTGRSY